MGWKTGVTTHSLFCLNSEKEDDPQLSCKSNHNAYEGGETKHQGWGKGKQLLRGQIQYM